MQRPNSRDSDVLRPDLYQSNNGTAVCDPPSRPKRQENNKPSNGASPKLNNGKIGDVVFAPTTPGLACEMRRVLLKAVDIAREHDQRKHMFGRRAVIAAYRGNLGFAGADGAARFALDKCHAERAGTLDLTEMGFDGEPEEFFDWWEEAGGGVHFDGAVDFISRAEQLTKWLQKPRAGDDVAIVDQAVDEVKDPIGDVDPRAFHGPLGRIALRTQPETEANPLFVLAHLMAFFGIAVGRQAHFVVSGSRHRLNLFIGVVGLSGTSRKGMAGDVASAIFHRVDPYFAEENITDGLNSGAGLLWHLRDETFKQTRDGDTIADPGVSDKRRVFLESELASVLKQGHRDHDPMTELLRKFWDGKDVVRSNVRNDPLKVTGGHIGIVGHCTPADVEIHLTDTDKGNGTANRFLWLFGTRSKVLPSGGNLFGLLDFLGEDLKAIIDSIEFARGVTVILRTPEATKRWEELYREFDDVPTGKLGAFFVRGAPQVMRMASIFALADRKDRVDVEHLEAALAIWHHSSRSLKFMFGGDGDPAADKLIAALKVAGDAGLTKREITNDVFNRNKDTETLDALLTKLLAYRLISQVPVVVKGPGRPAHRYRLNRWGAGS
jgi:hypothetical protein